MFQMLSKLNQQPFFVLNLISLSVGAIFSFALAPYHFWILALLSPAVLFCITNNLTPSKAFWNGWCFGFGMWFVGVFWLYTSIHVYGNVPSAMAVFMVALLALGMGLFTAIQCWLYRRFFKPNAWTYSAIWVMFEWVKTWFLTGFPWLFVGYAFIGVRFAEYGLANYAPVLGVLGVSFVAVLLACSVIKLLEKQFKSAVVITLVLLCMIPLHFITQVSEKKAPPLRVSLVQGNISQDQKWLEDNRLTTLQIYAKLSQTEWGRDLVVWPEAAIPMTQIDAADFIDEIIQKANENKTLWMSGIPYIEFAKNSAQSFVYYNAIMAGGVGDEQVYFKQRLVPFGEYLPLKNIIGNILPGVAQGIADFQLGAKNQKPFQVKNHALSAAICYEVAYPNLTRKNATQSDFILTVSNDAWFTGTAGPWQHLQMVQMRAKENGRWVIRAANTGVTAIINQQGDIVSALPMDHEGVLRGDVPALQGETIYQKFGDYPILILVILLLLCQVNRKTRDENQH